MGSRKYGEPQLSFARKSLPAGGENFYGNEGVRYGYIYPHLSRKKIGMNLFLFLPFLILVRSRNGFSEIWIDRCRTMPFMNNIQMHILNFELNRFIKLFLCVDSDI